MGWFGWRGRAVRLHTSEEKKSKGNELVLNCEEFGGVVMKEIEKAVDATNDLVIEVCSGLGKVGCERKVVNDRSGVGEDSNRSCVTLEEKMIGDTKIGRTGWSGGIEVDVGGIDHMALCI